MNTIDLLIDKLNKKYDPLSEFNKSLIEGVVISLPSEHQQLKHLLEFFKQKYADAFVLARLTDPERLKAN